MNEMVFEVTQESDGGFLRGVPHGEHLHARRYVKEAVEAFYFDRTKPTSIRLHLMRGFVGQAILPAAAF